MTATTAVSERKPEADRYRLSLTTFYPAVKKDFALGFRTFVLQGGEDPWYHDEKVCQIVSAIKERFPECAVTYRIGEKSKESYQAYFNAGAERYLLRHETAEPEHYQNYTLTA